MQIQTYPDQLHCGGFDSENPRWYVAHTRPNHEKRVAKQLGQRRLEHLLPLYNSIRQWKDRKVRLAMPLFPGYVFARFSLRERLRVLEIPGVAGLVGFGTRPAQLADEEIESVQRCMSCPGEIKPHPYLCVGRRARVKSGPLRGLEGFIVQLKNRTRMVLSFDLIQRSATLDADQIELEPVVSSTQASEAASKDPIVIASPLFSVRELGAPR